MQKLFSVVPLIEGERITLRRITGADAAALERLAHPVTDLLLEIFTSESDGGNEALTAQYFGITLVQPRIVGGAQSKKGRTVASCWPFCSPVGVSLPLPSSSSWGGSVGGLLALLRRSPTGIPYLSSK